MNRRELRTAKLAMGAVLAVLVLATFGGLLWMQVMKLNAEATLEDPLVRVVVTTPREELFDGVVGADTPLEALERAGLSAGFGVARTADGGSLQAAAGHRNGDGGRWAYSLERDGTGLDAPGPEGTEPLIPNDIVRWTWKSQ